MKFVGCNNLRQFSGINKYCIFLNYPQKGANYFEYLARTETGFQNLLCNAYKIQTHGKGF